MIFLDTADLADMLHFVVLRFRKVIQSNAGRNHPVFEFRNSEAFQRGGPEMLQEQVSGKFEGENPLLEIRKVKFIAKGFDELLPLILLYNNF